MFASRSLSCAALFKLPCRLAVGVFLIAMQNSMEARGEEWGILDRWLRVTISPETTYLTEPVAEDGWIDYFAAVNALAARGVTVENNAAADLWATVGPGIVPEPHRQAYFGSPNFQKYVGDPPSEDGACFVDLVTFAKQEGHELAQPREGDNEKSVEQRLLEHLEEAVAGPWREAEFPFLAKWIAANDETLAIVRQAAEKPMYYSPLVRFNFGEEWLNRGYPGFANFELYFFDPFVFPAQDLTLMQLARAMLATGKGRFADALDDMEAYLKLVRKFARIPDWRINWLAIYFEIRALNACRAWLQHHPLPADQLHDLQRMNTRIGDFLLRLDERMLIARLALLDFLSDIPRHRAGPMKMLVPHRDRPEFLEWIDFWTLFVIDWNMVLREVNEGVDETILAARLPTYELRKAAERNIINDINNRRRLAQRRLQNFKYEHWLFRVLTIRTYTADYFAHVVLFLSLPGATHNEWEYLSARTNLNKLAIAVERFHRTHGEYPHELQELAPDFIKAIPPDPFREEGFIYHRVKGGFVLYSVYRNGKDDGGKTDSNGKDDISIAIDHSSKNGIED